MDDLEKLLYMLEIQILRDQKDRAIAGLKKRGFSDERLLIIDQIVALDDLRKDQQTQLDVQLNERNTLSDEIGNLFKSGKAQEANQLKIKVQAIKEAAETLEVKLQQTKSDLDAIDVYKRQVHINYFFNTYALIRARICYFTRMVSETVSL